MGDLAAPTTMLRKRRRSTLLRAVAAILVCLFALLLSYALWTVYENTLTPASLDQGSLSNAKPSSRPERSPTAARSLEADGAEAIWTAATAVDREATRGRLWCPVQR